MKKSALNNSKKTGQTHFMTDGIEKIYEDIKLPKRATAGSAGYDFIRRWLLN